MNTSKIEHWFTPIMSAIILVAILVGFVYLHSEISSLKISNSPVPSTSSPPTSTPTSTPTPTPLQLQIAGVTAILNVTAESTLYINGTVTNNSSNTAYNVGLSVFADGYPFIISNPSKFILINMTVPIIAGTYVQTSNNSASINGGQSINSNDIPLSTLTPYESVFIEIKIYPQYQTQTPTLYDLTVSLVGTNSPS